MNKDDIMLSVLCVRAAGYALRVSYFGSGLRVLAVPVLDSDHYPVAALSVAVPQIQLSVDEFRDRALEAVRRAAKDIARVVEASGTISAAV
jgi:IclR family transcriptional regulator, pca regulon regulatory protein